MVEIDAETVQRVARWCAEAGRQAGDLEIVRALAPLNWDELLAVRAILADPPPSRPLGPHALVDLARGAPADAAAEREREGRYRAEAADAEEASAPALAAAPAPPPRQRKKQAPARRRQVVIHRARDRVSPPSAPAPSLPLVDELRLAAGRAVLERLVRRHGARRAAIVEQLAAGWRRMDGSAAAEPDLAALLDLHGMAHAFARRERDELLHALRASGGVRSLAARRAGLAGPAELDAALERLDARAPAERIREERRAEIRGRATLAERLHLLLAEEERLRDLGLLEEFEADLRIRLPEHVRALRAGPEPVADGLARSLSLPGETVERIAARFGVELGAAGPRGTAARPRGAPGSRPGVPSRRGPTSSRPGTSSSRPGTSSRRGTTSRPGAPSRPGGTARRGTTPPRPGGAARQGAPPRRGAPPRPGAPARRGSPPRPGGARPPKAPRPRGGPRRSP
jgi:hypothetical protein